MEARSADFRMQRQNCLFDQYIEAGAGIEPANRGFADLGLTTWLPRRVARERNYRMQADAVNLVTAAIAAKAIGGMEFWD
jgi:hypothetical protein